jgi:hypothetical protein
LCCGLSGFERVADAALRHSILAELGKSKARIRHDRRMTKKFQPDLGFFVVSAKAGERSRQLAIGDRTGPPRAHLARHLHCLGKIAACKQAIEMSDRRFEAGWFVRQPRNAQQFNREN